MEVKRKNVIVKGQQESFKITMKAVIMVKRWPSWAYILCALGWSPLIVIAKDLKINY